MNLPFKNFRLMLAIAMLACLIPVMAGAQTDANDQQPEGDRRVQLMNPSNGQIFHSGQSVKILLSADATLKARSFVVDAPGIGDLSPEEYTDSGFQLDMVVPPTFVGPLTLTPSVYDSQGLLIVGKPVNILIQPAGILQGLAFEQNDFRFKTPGPQINLKLQGVYPGNVVADITSSAMGTLYKTSNKDVVAIDQSGNVKAVGYGTASVSATNGQYVDFATFTVEDPDSPLPPVDVTKNFSFQKTTPQLDPKTGLYTQSVTFTSVLINPTIGPLFFVPGGLSPAIKLTDSYGSQLLQPKGTPYIPLPLADGISIPSRGGMKLFLQFRTTDPNKIQYVPQVFRSAAPL